MADVALETAERRVEAAFAAIEHDNARLGCFIETDRERALAAARASDARRRCGNALGALDGRTVAVKANIAVEGLAWSAGIGARRGVVAGRDAAAVGRLRACGAIVLGTVNLAEGAFGATTVNPFFGTTRNPRDAEYNAGGSSGGSACAVAAGLADFALGTDTLGSVRLPAAYCGIAGWKPSRGAIADDGVVPLCKEYDTIGFLASRASELPPIAAAFGIAPLACIAGWPAVVVPEGFLAAVEAPVREAFDAALGIVQSFAEVRPYRGPLPDLSSLRRACLLRCEHEAARYYESSVEADPDGFSVALRSYLSFGAATGTARLVTAAGRIERALELLSTLFEAGAFIVLPTAPCLAPLAQSAGPDDAANLTGWASAMGCAAISVPAPALPGRALPAGVQIVGKPGTDAATIAFAQAYESAAAENRAAGRP